MIPLTMGELREPWQPTPCGWQRSTGRGAYRDKRFGE
jgi:hypothetical protein